MQTIRSIIFEAAVIPLCSLMLRRLYGLVRMITNRNMSNTMHQTLLNVTKLRYTTHWDTKKWIGRGVDSHNYQQWNHGFGMFNRGITWDWAVTRVLGHAWFSDPITMARDDFTSGHEAVTTTDSSGPSAHRTCIRESQQKAKSLHAVIMGHPIGTCQNKDPITLWQRECMRLD